MFLSLLFVYFKYGLMEHYFFSHTELTDAPAGNNVFRWVFSQTTDRCTMEGKTVRKWVLAETTHWCTSRQNCVQVSFSSNNRLIYWQAKLSACEFWLTQLTRRTSARTSWRMVKTPKKLVRSEDPLNAIRAKIRATSLRVISNYTLNISKS